MRGSPGSRFQPLPGKTAKSASPIASPGLGLRVCMHVSNHCGAAVGCQIVVPSD
jgi:hypothetical protein